MYNSICRYGAVEARWPHKPKDGGSKPSTGRLFNIKLINYFNTYNSYHELYLLNLCFIYKLMCHTSVLR